MPSQFWLANLLNLLCLTGTGTLILLPLYQESEGLARWEIGVASAAGSLAATLVRIRLGGWIERFGYRNFIIAGALAAGLGTLAYPYVPARLGPVLLLRCLQGVAMAVYFTALWARMIAASPPGRINEVSGWFGISGLLAGALGPILGEQAHRQTLGFPPVFWLGGGLGLAGGLIALLLRELPPPSDERPPSVGFWEVLLRPAMAGALLGSLVFGGALGCFNTFIAPYVASAGLHGIGLMFALYIGCSVVVRLRIGALADRLGPARIILPALLCVGTGMLLISGLSLGGFPLLLGAGMVIGSGHGLCYPALSTLTQLRSGTRAVGTAASVFTAAMEMGLLSGAAIAGVVAHHFGYPAAFGGAGAVVIVGCLLFARWER